MKNTFIYTLGRMFPKAAQFLLLPIYSRYLSPSDYGIVSSMLVLSTILSILFSLAIDRSIPRLYFDYKTEKEKRDYLGTMFFSLLSIATFMLLIIFLCKSLIANLFSSIPFYPFYLYAILTSYLTVMGLIPKAYLQVEQKAGKFVLLSIAEFALSTIFILYFITVALKGAEGMLLAQLLKSIFFFPVFIIISIKIINISFSKKILVDGLTFSLPMIPALLSAFILNLSDRIFIERYFSLQDVGSYSMSYKMAEILLVFSTSIFSAYNPLFYKVANEDDVILAKKKLYTYNRVVAIILTFISTSIALFSEEFIFLLSDQYQNAYKLVPLIILGVFMGQLGGLLNISIYQSKKSKEMMYMILLSAILNIFLNYILVPHLGAFGAALATTITFFMYFILKLWYAKRCFYIPFDWKYISIYFVIAILLVLAFMSLNLSIISTLVLKFLSMVLFAFIILLFNKSDIINIFKRRSK